MGGGEKPSNQGRDHASRDSSRSSSVNDQPEPQDEHDARHEGPLAVSATPVPVPRDNAQSTAHGSVRPPQPPASLEKGRSQPSLEGRWERGRQLPSEVPRGHLGDRGWSRDGGDRGARSFQTRRDQRGPELDARSEPYRPYPQPREEEEQKGDGGSATVTPRQEPIEALLSTEPAIVGTGGERGEAGGRGGEGAAAGPAALDDQVNTTQVSKTEADAETASGGGAVTSGYQGDTLRIIRIAEPVHYTADDDTFTSIFNTLSDESYKVALAHMPNSEAVEIAIEAREGRHNSHYTRASRETLLYHFFVAWKLAVKSVIGRLSLLGECGAVFSLHTGRWRTRNSHHYHLIVDRHAVLRVAAARRTEQSDDESRFVHLIYHTNSHPEVIVPSTAEAGGGREGKQGAEGGAGKGAEGPGAGGVPVRLVLVDQEKGLFSIRNAHDGLTMDGPMDDGWTIWFPFHGEGEQRFQFESEPASDICQQPCWLVPAYVEKHFSVGRIFRGRSFGAPGANYLMVDECNDRLTMTKDMERAPCWSLVPTGSASQRLQPPVRQRTIRSYGSTELSLPPPPEYNHWHPRPNKYFAQDLVSTGGIKHSGRPFSLYDLPHHDDYLQLELVPHPFLPMLGFRVITPPESTPSQKSVYDVMQAMLDIIQSFSLDSHAVITTSRMRAVSQADAAVGPTLLTVPIIEEMEEPKVWSDPCMMGYILMDSTKFVKHHPGGQEAASSWLRLFTKHGDRYVYT